MQRAFSFDMPEESKKQKKFAQLQSLRKPEHQFSLILYCRILHIKPIIWRKFQVPSTTSLELFHKVLLCSFGWASPGYHGYIFREFPRHPRVNGMDTYGLCYGPRDTHGLDDMVHGQRLGLFYINSDEVFVSDFLKQKGHKLLYEYDLGDSWEHKITVEDVIPYDPQIKLFDGKCACPPEDFGGRHEYSKALYSFKHHEGTKYRDYVHSANHAYNYRHAHETGKSHFDPNVVDLEACRRQLLVLVDPKEAKRLAKQQYRATGKTISCSCALCVRDKEPPRIPPSSPFAGITMLNQRGGEYDPTDRQASNLQRDQVEYIGDKDGIHCCAYCLDRECPNNPQMKFKACGQCVMKYYCSVTCQKLDWRWRHKVWCTKYVVQPTLQPELMKSLRDGAEKKKTK